MPRRSAAALILLAESLRQVGEDPDPVLARYGLDARRMDATAFVDRDLERRVSEAIAESLRNPLSGLRAGSGLGIGTYGPFTLLLLTAENALADIRAAIEFEALTFLFGHLAFEPGRGHSALLLRPERLAGRAFRFRVDLEVAGTLKLMQDLHRAAQVDVAPERIVMPYPKPAESAQYEIAFGCPLEWGGSEARFLFANERLRKRFATADPGAHAVLRTQCQRLRIELDAESTDLASRVRSYLAACAGHMPVAAEAASVVGMSERSLRRALGRERTSFRSLLDEVRLQKAVELLNDRRLPVEEIARSLGYSEPAGFIHAFRRWTGKSPARFRREQRHGAGRFPDRPVRRSS
jgi:AraC-like DNA-binding protein